MYFVTVGQLQLHKLRNSDEDLVNNAQLLRLRFRAKQTVHLGKLGMKFWIRICLTWNPGIKAV